MNKKSKSGKISNGLKKKNPEKKIAILEGALKVFGEKGFDATTISAISKSAGIADATLYEYFNSKEDVLFTIAEYYTNREIKRMQEVNHFIHDARERMRMLIQAHLEFYEKNRLYSSVALLNLKGNRNFINSQAYTVVRESTRGFVTTFEEGVEKGLFRGDIDGYLVRNMILGFIEHLTIQWLLIGRPQKISEHRDVIFDMVMRAIVAPDLPSD